MRRGYKRCAGTKRARTGKGNEKGVWGSLPCLLVLTLRPRKGFLGLALLRCGDKRQKGENMRFAKYLLALVFAFCAFTSITNAQTVFLGGGSSALFQELGQASYNLVNVP